MTPPRLSPADGPADPPSSRPRSGVLAAPVFAFDIAPAAGVQRVEVPELRTIAITPDTVLHWAFYADGADAALAPHAALAVSVDVRVEDVRAEDVRVEGEGRRLGDDPAVRDRYGFAITPDAQFAARWSMPEQWNADTVSLAPLAGRRGVVELVFGAESLTDVDGLPSRVSGFAQVLVEERVAAASDLPAVERVDTRRGTHSGARFSRGNTIPAVARPHGFTFVTPATDAADARWPYRPFVHDDRRGRRMEALQFSHQPSPWIGDRSVLQLMPFADTPASDHATRRRWIVAGSERARPHEYAAELADAHGARIRAEMTATLHGAAFRVRSDDAGARVGFVIDQLSDEGRLSWTDDGGFAGWIPEGPEDWGNAPRCYFAGRLIGTDPEEAPAERGRLEDAGRGRVAGFVAGRGSLEVRVAVSFLSIEQAERSLGLELDAETGFEDLRADAAASWNRLLDRVTIPPLPATDAPYRALADEEDRARIAAALHRMHLYPNTAAEDTGSAGAPSSAFADVFAERTTFGETQTSAPVVDGELVVNNGYWDTYRTEWPGLALLDPTLAGRLLDGQLAQYRRGGWMARWSAPGYVDSMVGTSSDQIFADAARWGIEFDRREAFESGWRNACEPGPDARRGRKGIDRGRFTGYISSAVPEGMSWSIENAISDAALGRFAAQLASDRGTSSTGAARYRAFSRYFANRALSYRALFDPETGFFRGRDDRGAFSSEPFDPRTWGGDNVETNAWGMSTGAVHDGDGLADLYGGRAGLRLHLDALFAEPETADQRFGGAYGTVIHEQREARALRAGMCGISNQPAHHIPFMYAFTDQPWRAGETARELAGRLFAGAHIGQGFPGDEDNGEMSAWWLWAALGLYPLELASGVLRIGSPLLDDIRVDRGDGSTLRIRSRRSSPSAHVLHEARLNGIPLTTAELPVDALVDSAAGELVLDLVFGDDPKDWLGGVRETDAVLWRPDLTATAGSPIASAGVRHAARAFDDGDPSGAEGVVLHPGKWIGWRFAEDRAVSDVSVTLASAASSAALVWEVETASGWEPVAVTTEVELPADRTTPFTLAGRTVTSALRVRAEAEVTVRQLELFDLG
ncbi:GH92 family glycosyl hydrolase [Microbacterium sp. 1.5R]|uniref:GH92 family glycosyl hydrolase n=1 Tax=Microbacterium sp. 1.5R TaxID=1916917 RepID=UPI00119FCC30|nr:GH92 family glycosyl hydrolase [Microbacterium sp. 1.5R]